MKKVFTLLTLALMSIGSAWGQTTIYSWEGGSEGATETGGTAAVSDGSSSSDAINEATTTIDGTYYVIKLQGKNNDATGYTYITLNQALQENDQIKISGFQNKNATNKVVNIKLLFYQDETEKGNITEATDANWVNLYNDAKYANADKPETKTFDVTAALAGSKVIRIFRSKSGTNLWINKIEITRADATAPTITTQPVGGKYVDGYAIPALKVAATASAGTLSYQWYSCDDAEKTNAAAISGATNASYTPNKSSFYFCRVTDSNGSTDTNVVEVTISPAAAPSFVSITSSATSVPRGAASTITAEIAGNPDPAIQWYSNTENKNTGGTIIDGATDLTLKLANAAVGTFYYYAVAHNTEGNAASDVVAITVTDPDIYRTGYNTYYLAEDDVVVSGAKVYCDAITMEYSTADYKVAVEDNSISTLNANYVAFVTASSTNGWGVTFTPSVDGVLSVGIIINGGKEFAVSNVTSFSYNGLQDEGADTPMTASAGTIEGKTWKPEKKQYTIITINVTKGANYSFNVSGSKMCFYGFEFTPSTYTAKIAASGYTTFASASALDFANAVEEGTTNKTLTAFVVSSVTKESVTLTAVESAPASTGVVLKGTTSTTYTIPVSASPASVGTNKLTASVSGATVEANSVYVVSGGKFCLYTGTSIPAGKAYLAKSEVPADASELNLDFNGETTGISTVDNSKKNFLNGDFYNLSGQRVAQPTKGLYIVNGRKVIVK